MNFGVHTKKGNYKLTGVHSTQFVADDAVARFRQTPAKTPIFAILSIYNLHTPNKPMAQDVGDRRCANMPAYKPDNYNELDVSDKPSGIQALPLLPYVDGWPMVGYCEEMLGVDRAIGQVIDELEVQGRLDNTLLVFHADNGMAWGAHRIGQNKIWPYTTPVPLYMRLPSAGWGDTHTVIDEHASNIDLAPTFCELAETCTLGPFAYNDGPDGVSLVPLIEGDAPDLGRDAVLEAMYLKGGMSYTALRTTALYDSDNRWHYVEYTNGERELYDLVADEWELENRAYDPAYADVVAALHDKLAVLRLEGIRPGTGTVRIALDTTPDTGTDFSFDGDLGAFALDDDGDGTLPKEQTFVVPSGRYQFTRPGVAPWAPLALMCTGVHISGVLIGRVTVYVHAGETVSCTYTDRGPQPDTSITPTTAGLYKKDNLYQVNPTAKQTVRRNDVRVGSSYDYQVRIQNDGRLRDSFGITAEATGPSTVQASYFVGGIDVTADVAAGTYALPQLAPGAAAARARRRRSDGRAPDDRPGHAVRLGLQAGHPRQFSARPKDSRRRPRCRRTLDRLVARIFGIGRLQGLVRPGTTR